MGKTGEREPLQLPPENFLMILHPATPGEPSICTQLEREATEWHESNFITSFLCCISLLVMKPLFLMSFMEVHDCAMPKKHTQITVYGSSFPLAKQNAQVRANSSVTSAEKIIHFSNHYSI